MENETKIDGDAKRSTVKKTVGRLCCITILVALCLFGAAGTILWVSGWVFMVSYFLVLITLTRLVFRSSPELVHERMGASHKAKSWDKIIVPILAMVLPLLSVVLAGLDHRFSWSHGFGMTSKILAFCVMMIGNALTVWAMRVNRFFSSYVRIQSDRGHFVVSNGPYKWVRHPGYTGSIMFNVASPVLIGSFPAVAVDVVFGLLMTIRTVLEDATLRAELSGYDAYSKKTRWRLFPLIW